MSGAFATYTKVQGVYHIELTINGEFAGGGSTGTPHYDEAYYFASKAAKAKGVELQRFAPAPISNPALKQAQEHWLTLAIQEEALADYFDSKGQPYGDTSSYRVRADSYRRTVAALQIQIDTGVAVCSCHFRPFKKEA